MRLIETGNHPQQRGLAATGGPHHGKDFTGTANKVGLQWNPLGLMDADMQICQGHFNLPSRRDSPVVNASVVMANSKSTSDIVPAEAKSNAWTLS